MHPPVAPAGKTAARDALGGRVLDVSGQAGEHHAARVARVEMLGCGGALVGRQMAAQKADHGVFVETSGHRSHCLGSVPNGRTIGP